MRKNRLTVKENRGSEVAAVKNSGGYFVHISPFHDRHRKKKLIIRREGERDVELNGRQIQSLRRVLTALD